MAAALLALVLGASAQVQEPNFAQELFVGHAALDDATGLAWAPDGSNRLFVALKGGTIRIIKNGTLLGTAFATETVHTNSECGLIGIAFHLDHVPNPDVLYLYAFITVSASEQRIVRYVATQDTASGRIEVVTGLPTAGNNHDGGAIGIGPDQKLYWAIGDLGNGTGVDNDLSSLASKVGRANLNGSKPGDNPFDDAGGPNNDYIWARGFRNPFTLTFHPVTGDLWVNVVGTNWEQIFLVTAGSHGGWNDYEGTSIPATAPYIPPKLMYRTNGSSTINNGSNGGAISGGWFYRGLVFPASHRYNFFWGDYVSGRIYRSVLDGTHKTITATTLFALGAGSIVDMEEGPDGALYYARRSGSGIYRIRYTGTSSAAILVTASALSVNEGANATFGVRLQSAPSGNVTVDVARSSGDPDATASPASLTFTAGNWMTNQTVTVSAAHDADAVNDGATIRCSAAGMPGQDVAVTVLDDDRPPGAPNALISQPVNGATVSGSTAEFFGDGTDPQGTGTLHRAEFFVDGVLVYTDTTAGGHYHVGGGHGLWDTTTLADGPHTLRMTVYDNTSPARLSGSHEIVIVSANGVAGGGGGGGGDSGCGALGLEMLLLSAGLLYLRRLRRPRSFSPTAA